MVGAQYQRCRPFLVPPKPRSEETLVQTITVYTVWAIQPQNEGDPTRQAPRPSLSKEWDRSREAARDVKNQEDLGTQERRGREFPGGKSVCHGVRPPGVLQLHSLEHEQNSRHLIEKTAELHLL